MSAMGMASHQVEILYDFEADLNTTPICAGSIISSYLILTMFGCLKGKNESLIKIRANGENQNQSQIRMIDEIFSFAALDSDASPFDVAVIRLNSELELDDLHTSKIPYSQDQLPENEDSSGKTSVCLENEVGEVGTVAPFACPQILAGKHGEGQNFICVHPDENASFTGNGSSPLHFPLLGSGLICSDILYGLLAVNSSNDEYENPRGNRVYTNVAQYFHWIQLLFDNDYESASISSGAAEVNQTESSDAVPVPYQLSIRFNGRRICGGVILDKKTVLSAAHCFDPKYFKVQSMDLNRFLLVAGERNLNRNDSEQILKIDKLYKHPKYLNVFKGYDIAVIRVKGQFNFNDRVNNVWISSPTTLDFQDVNTIGTAFGWSKTETETGDQIQSSPVLLSVDLGFLDHLRCKKTWPFLTNSMLCGYSNFSNICGVEFDSGGPLVIKNHGDGPHTKKDLLVGISSFGPKRCEQQNMSNGFTNVANFYPWISQVRSNSLCSSAQFQCFSGQCIQKEMKCDKKMDCEDGSDERVCSPIAWSCGGLVKVFYSNEIIWRAPTSHPRHNSSCLWLIANPNGDRPITQVKILNDSQYEFDTDSSQLFILQNLTGNELPTFLLTKTDFEYQFFQPFFALYIRTNSSRPNSGIHIKISDKSETTSSYRKPTKVHGAVLKGRSSTFSSLAQTFSFVSSESNTKNANVNVNVTFLSQNKIATFEEENFGVLLKPTEDGGRILVRLDSLQVAEKKDSLDIVSYRKNEQNLAHLKRFHSAGSWSNQIYNGDENEPILMYFHSGASNQSKLMNLTFVERPKVSPTSICGGFLNLEDELEIVYQIPKKAESWSWNSTLSESQEMNCVWIIRNLNGSSIDLTLFHNPSADFVAASSLLSVLYGFSFSNFFIKELDQKYETLNLETSFMTLTFRSNSSVPNTGFHLYLRNPELDKSKSGRGQRPKEVVKGIRLLPNATLQHFAYPFPPVKKYGSNKRVFIMAQPRPRGRGRIEVTVNFVDTQFKYDWLSIITYRKKMQLYGTLFRFYGQGRGSEVVYYGDEDEPLLIYFHSNHGVNFGGFELSYSERPMAPVNSTCGGFINLEQEHEIVYQVPTENQGMEIHCQWVVANARGTTMEATLFDNQQAQFAPDTDSLLGLHAFNRGNFSTEILSTSYKKYKIPSPILILHFRSNPPGNESIINRGFHLLLKNPQGYFKNLAPQPAVQDIRLFPTPSLNSSAREFSYPLESALELELELAYENGNKTEIETRIRIGNGSETETGKEIEAKSRTRKAAEIETEIEIQTGNETEIEIRTGNETETGIRTRNETRNETKTEDEIEIKTEIETGTRDETGKITANGTYKNNERVFITIQPSQPGARIKLKILAVDTETNFDWLDVITRQKENEKFAYVFRFYGTGKWTDKIFYGEEDEVFILYFHSDQETVATGFKISYSEILPSNVCGGFIELEEDHDVVYQMPGPAKENLTSKTVCVWIIANKRGESMEATILNNPAAQFHPAESYLIGLHTFKAESFLSEPMLEKNTSYKIDAPLMALYFRFTSGSNFSNAGFHLQLRNPGYQKKKAEEQPRVKDIRITPTANDTEFSYPSFSDIYRNQSQLQLENKVFVILEPREKNISVQLKLERLDIENGGGWLDLITYSEKNKILEFRYKTTSGGQINKQFESEKGEPLILYFQSNPSARPKSFKLTHSENRGKKRESG